LCTPGPCSCRLPERRTLAQELRIACSLAQQEREGGVSAFVSPLAQVGAGCSSPRDPRVAAGLRACRLRQPRQQRL
jgi:hypothetical protein